ncbi:MAG TPA: hypothetical protein VGE11_11715 [Pseudonocardia sp.]
MPTYVETRGSGLPDDYKFLGGGPARAWWYQDYRDQTTFDHPTVLVERDALGWRLYVGAIPSGRHDPTGSTNRITVVAEGAQDGDDVDREALVRLVEVWLADVAEQREQGRARRALDEVFTADVVDRLYTDDGPADVVRARLREACERLGGPVRHPQAADLPGSWIAPVRGRSGRTAFVARVRALLNGESSGSAIFVNLVDRADVFAREPDDPPLAVLVTDPGETLELDPLPLPTRARPPKKAQGPITPMSVPPGRRRTRTLVALVLLALVIGLVWLLAPEAPGTGLAPTPPVPARTN